MYSNSLISNAPIPLYSSMESVNFLSKLNFNCLTLSNNHTFDFNIELSEYRKYLPITLNTVGAADTLQGSMSPVRVGEFTLFNFGWQTIGVKPATNKRAGCAPLRRKKILESLAEYIKANQKEKVVVILHWNYEFELYPLPLDREFARKLAELGVYATVGHHSHIIQGYEYFGEMPVFYGIGNFYMPKFKFGNYNLEYPDFANTGVCIDISDRLNIKLYTSKNIENNLNIDGPYSLKEKEYLFSREFAGMSKAQYLDFFKRNRKKSFLLPIYSEFGVQEVLFDFLVKVRQSIIDTLVKLKIK